jgi:quinol monooxygenase YgiN
MNPYILFGAFVAQEGKADELLAILKSGHDMNSFPGCQEYRVFMDSADNNKLWIFESWDSAEAHKESLNDPIIKEQIVKAMPLIASFAEHFTLLHT